MLIMQTNMNLLTHKFSRILSYTGIHTKGNNYSFNKFSIEHSKGLLTHNRKGLIFVVILKYKNKLSVNAKTLPISNLD